MGSLLSGGLAPTVANSSGLSGPPRLPDFETDQECAWADGASLPGSNIIPQQVPGYYDPVIDPDEPGVLNSYVFVPVNYNTVKPSVQSTQAGCLATVTSSVPETTQYVTSFVKTCDGLRWTQACYHYSSIADNWGASVITCSRIKAPVRTLPQRWDA